MFFKCGLIVDDSRRSLNQGKVEPDVQAQCSVGPPGLSLVQSHPGPALALQGEGRRSGVAPAPCIALGGGRWELLFRACGVCGPLWLCLVICSSQEARGCLGTVCLEWFSVYSEIIGVLGLVLLSSLSIMLFPWLCHLCVTNVLLHFCNAEIKVLTFFQFHWMQFI